MGTLLSFSALFLSLYLVQLRPGSLGPLDALSGSVIGYSTEEIGLLGSAHFVRSIIACDVPPLRSSELGLSLTLPRAPALRHTAVRLFPFLKVTFPRS